MPFRTTTQGIPRALTPIMSPNSRDTFRAITQGTPTIPPLKHHQKPCRSQLQNQQPKVAAAKSLGGEHIPPGAVSSHTAWQGTRIAKRQAPQNVHCYQVPLGRTLMTARRHTLSASLEFYLPLGGSHYAAGRYTRTDVIMIFLHFYATANPPLSHFTMPKTTNPLNYYIIATPYSLGFPILILSLS